MSQDVNEILRLKSECSMPRDEDDDGVDETKRKSRNLSEKKRRDQFNMLINELNSIVSSNNRKMDKSTVLKAAINNLKLYNENVTRSKEFEISEEWKPSFLTNEEYSCLILQSLNGFIFVFSSCGKILYASSSLAIALGYFLEEILTLNIYDLVSENDRSYLENIFFMSTMNNLYTENEDNSLVFNCQFTRKQTSASEVMFEPVEFTGRIKTQDMPNVLTSNQENGQEFNKPLIFVGLVKLLNSTLYNEVVPRDNLNAEFVSYHNFEWKFLFLDERASSIIGYSPFEVLGTSGYDYYHVDDLDNIITHHKTLMARDKGVSGYYRFMTKGHQWIWLQTTAHIHRREWNSRVEFVMCTHRVINPSVPKNGTESEAQMLDHNTSYSSSSSTSTGCSDKTSSSPPSWPSTTSGSNYGQSSDQVSQNCEEYFPDDYSVSSSTTNPEMCVHKKRKTHRKFHRFHRSVDYTSTSSDTSNNYNNFSFGDEFCMTSSRNVNYEFSLETPSSIENAESDCALEDSLQKKCTQLQQIIRDRTEELRVVSEQLYIARSATQHKNECALNENSNEEPVVLHHFAHIPNVDEHQ